MFSQLTQEIQKDFKERHLNADEEDNCNTK